MTFVDRRVRYAAVVLLLALLACGAIFFSRLRVEESARRVEIAMDYNDFITLARAYNYQPAAFLAAMRRAGLTSLALTEELGSALTGSTSTDGYAISGVSLANQARLSSVSNGTLKAILTAHKLNGADMYLIAFTPQAFRRYMQQLPLHFERSGIHVLSKTLPYVISVRTQVDYFNSTALGIPQDQLSLARTLQLLVIPRFQNDERLGDGQLLAMFNDLRTRKVSTVIFFGLRNQVLGFPDHLKDTARVFAVRRDLNYGEIEAYDPSQVQKGNVELANLIPGRTVRVQAISKVELDKLSLPEIVARYELGVRERNIRVVYLRPFAHQYNNLSIEKTNVEMVHQIASDLKTRGFRLGRASPIPLYRGNNRALIGLAALAVPSIFVLLLGFYGWYRPPWAIGAYAITIAIYLGGMFLHRDLLARSIVALAAALLFATAAFTILNAAFLERPKRRFWPQIGLSIGWTFAATVVALLGALVVTGLLSSPLVMEEVEPFRGVKLVLVLPPLIALALYLFTAKFASGAERARDLFAAPVRIYQILVAIVVLGAAALVVLRSGNQSDIAPSGFELALRSHLTAILSVRPRFKEFMIGFPMLMLLPALRVTDRRAVGILLSLGIGIGLADIIDTFSHLHTALLVSMLRVFNGFVIGVLIGIIAIAVYRTFRKP